MACGCGEKALKDGFEAGPLLLPCERRCAGARGLRTEVDDRRAFRDEEEACLKQFRHYQPVRAKDSEKREHYKAEDEEDEDEKEDEDKEDVVLAATLEVMKGLCSRR